MNWLKSIWCCRDDGALPGVLVLRMVDGVGSAILSPASGKIKVLWLLDDCNGWDGYTTAVVGPAGDLGSEAGAGLGLGEDWKFLSLDWAYMIKPSGSIAVVPVTSAIFPYRPIPVARFLASATSEALAFGTSLALRSARMTPVLIMAAAHGSDNLRGCNWASALLLLYCVILHWTVFNANAKKADVHQMILGNINGYHGAGDAICHTGRFRYRRLSCETGWVYEPPHCFGLGSAWAEGTRD